MTISALDLFFKHSFGFDNILETLDSVLPYNIVMLDANTYQYQQTIAGYSKEDVKVTVSKNCLIIEANSPEQKNSNIKYIHKGLSTKPFKISLPISKDVEVESAKMENGILFVTLIKRVKDQETHLIPIS